LVENEPTLTGETVVTVPYMTLAFTRRKSGFDAFIVDRSIAVLKEKSLFPDNSAVCSREKIPQDIGRISGSWPEALVLTELRSRRTPGSIQI